VLVHFRISSIRHLVSQDQENIQVVRTPEIIGGQRIRRSG